MKQDEEQQMRAPAEWHLLCITRLGKVTMLKNLDLCTAREAYKRLLPGTRPVDHQFCEQCGNVGSRRSGVGSSYGWRSCSSSSDADYLEKIEALGPDGVDLDPWHGVEPKVIVHCYVGTSFYDVDGKLHTILPHRKPEQPWDSRRADFWNNPKLWDGINPTERKCWMLEDAQ